MDQDIVYIIIYIVVAIVVLFISIVLHELMHGLTAYWLGDDTAKVHGRLTLNPIKHIDPILTIVLPLLLIISNLFLGTNLPIFGGAKPVPFRPDKVKGGEWGAALVGIVGPLTNLVLAFLFFAIDHFVFGVYSSGIWGGILSIFLNVGIMTNLGFFAFNILPIPPLDGSRVLYAIAPEYVRRVMESIEKMGLIVIFVIVVVLAAPLDFILGGIISFVLRLFNGIFGIF
ncbi:site-2 protease family protein [Candidatus Saccharibacteria bacterium]|nr:site-2 protease family protein [Candidatus Saccharibacteria bacterium]MCL1963094.1 site-2 protease family protein [Candidatus Saccharibacteria bacterium]